MSRRISRTARGAFAALVAAGLTFGAASAFAAPNARPVCPYDPDHGYIGTACIPNPYNNDYCRDACSQWWGSWNPGVCQDGCCSCAI